MSKQKYTVYQVMTRLFGNTQTQLQAWGDKATNGVGKLSDFTPEALLAIRDLGITHLWLTGIPHHATTSDYRAYGIPLDHPAIVKGRAGSPYAVRDYYAVHPDLADEPSNRNAEFLALIQRIHAAELKVIIDIVPNHVARTYQGLNNPVGVFDFGANDDTTLEYQRDNNFYYLPNTPFERPIFPAGFVPAAKSAHDYLEYPARWSGNGARASRPQFDDWYDTVKINFGVTPDGQIEFDRLPPGYHEQPYQVHAAFWQGKTLPDSWTKFRDIALYWLQQGVDGFRYDMAELVPVEFWSYLNTSIKQVNPEAFLLAEVYQPECYRDYIQLGKMDYLYNKVGLYDQLRAIVQGEGSTRELGRIEWQLRDIEHHMMNFLENHDEQRIASDAFAKDPHKAKPAMLVATCLSSAPVLIYFGQEVGEPGAENAGFGQPSRTSIFDYIGVPHHQRWMNHGRYDGAKLTEEERTLRQFYQRLLQLTITSPALTGNYHDLYAANFEGFYPNQDHLFAFARSCATQKLILVANFSAGQSHNLTLRLPSELMQQWSLSDGHYMLHDLLHQQDYRLSVDNHGGHVTMRLPGYATCFLQLTPP